jgi:hypothetical protein
MNVGQVRLKIMTRVEEDSEISFRIFIIIFIEETVEQILVTSGLGGIGVGAALR